MLPIVFEWDWEITRLIFMGVTYIIVGVLAAALITAFRRTLRNLEDHEAMD